MRVLLLHRSVTTLLHAAACLGAILTPWGCTPAATQRAAMLSGLREEPESPPPGSEVEDDVNWHLTLFHVHSLEGAWQHRGDTPPDARALEDPAHARLALRQAASWGFKAVVFMDHNSMTVSMDRQVRQDAQRLGVTLVPASEWSVGGPLGINLPLTLGQAGPHVGLVGYEMDGPNNVLRPAPTHVRPNRAQLQEMMDQTHARGGVVVLCHPNGLNHQWPSGLGPMDADLVEVDGPLVANPSAARARWHRWLMDGHRVGAVSGSDWHVGLVRHHPFLRANLVRSPLRSPAAMTDALRAGHVMVVRQPAKVPRVLLGADADGDGAPNDVRAGDVLIPAAGQERVRFTVRVVGAAGKSLVLYGAYSTQPFWRETFGRDDETRSLSVQLDPGRRTFVRAELYDNGDLLVVTNPLYFDPARPMPAVVPAPPGAPLMMGDPE